MGKSDLSSPLKSITFRCGECRTTFTGEPGRIIDAPENTWHPWEYFARCELCGAEAAQAHWEANLFKGWAAPKTPDGIAASIANLEGHPTPEETKRTRFNAMKHGLTARVANFFPARPGSYLQCDNCEHLEDESCRPFNACLKRMEVFARHQAAAETKDPELIRGLLSDNQAAIQALINDMILSIAQDGGTRLKTPEWYYDKDGDLHWVEHTDTNGQKTIMYKIEAHSLLKPLIDFISKNNMSLSDMEMTPKARDEQDTLKGYLDNASDEREAERDYQNRIHKQQSQLLELLRGNYSTPETIIDAEVVRDGS